MGMRIYRAFVLNVYLFRIRSLEINLFLIYLFLIFIHSFIHSFNVCSQYYSLQILPLFLRIFIRVSWCTSVLKWCARFGVNNEYRFNCRCSCRLAKSCSTRLYSIGRSVRASLAARTWWSSDDWSPVAVGRPFCRLLRCQCHATGSFLKYLLNIHVCVCAYVYENVCTCV